MSKQPFPYYIEDWILWLGRSKDAQGNDIDFPYYKAWPVKLANYDVTFITRSTDSIRKGVGFTQRQQEMAVKIVTKYQRQITQQLGHSVDYLKQHCPHRLVLREVDRSFSLTESSNYYHVRFPYDPPLVDRMHKFAALGTGDFRWDKNKRQWNIAQTERNLALIVDFIDNCNRSAWYVEPAIAQHITQIQLALADPYSAIPHLELVNDCIQVVNSTPGLTQGLSAHGFDLTGDIANLVFRADCFGLGIGPILTAQVKTQYSDIADALLITQNEIQSKSKLLDSCLTVDNLEQFMTTVAADSWIFISFSLKTSKFAAMIDRAVNINATGEKLFYTGGYRGRASEDFLKEVLSTDLSNSVVISDSVALLNSYMRNAAEPMRQFYLFGEK